MNENSALFQVVSSSLAEALVQDRPQHAALFKSTQEEKQKLQAEIEKKLELFAVTLKEGAFQLLKNGTADEACLKDFEKLAIFSRELSNEKARLYFEKMVSEGKSLIELSGFSDETLESFYKTAKELYDQKQYESAKAAFTYLALLDPSRYPFWLRTCSIGILLSCLRERPCSLRFRYSNRPLRSPMSSLLESLL